MCLIATVVSTNIFAGVISFETTANNQQPLDDQVLNFTDLFVTDGVEVSFGFDSDGDKILDSYAVFEQVGNSDTKRNSGFVGFNKIKDKPVPEFEQQLGKFFLRQEKAYKPFGVFTILYNAENPVTAASGEIWDIDGKENTEQFLVEAYNGQSLLDSVYSPLSSEQSFNGKPWSFGFSGLSNITKIEISFTGSKTKGIGLAFNNFSPIEDISHKQVQVSEPSTVLLYLLGICFLATARPKVNRA